MRVLLVEAPRVPCTGVCDFGLELESELRPSTPGTLLELVEGDEDDRACACAVVPVEVDRANIWFVGRSPNLGKSNWKSLFRIPLAPFRAVGLVLTPRRGGDRPTPLLLTHESRFRYSRSSICNRSTWAFKSPFS